MFNSITVTQHLFVSRYCRNTMLPAAFRHSACTNTEECFFTDLEKVAESGGAKDFLSVNHHNAYN